LCTIAAKQMRAKPNGHHTPRSSFMPKPATALTPTCKIVGEGASGESMPGSNSTKRTVPDAGARTVSKRRAVCATPPSSEDEEQTDQPPMARPCKQWTKTTRCALHVETKVGSRETAASWLSRGLFQCQIVLQTPSQASASLPSAYLLVPRPAMYPPWVTFPHIQAAIYLLGRRGRGRGRLSGAPVQLSLDLPGRRGERGGV
jgi:hypothetical protein